MKQMLKLGIVLALFASVACVMLALVNNLTSSVIAENKAKEVSKEFLHHFAGKAEIVLDSGILSYTRLLSVAESKHASLIALPTSGKISFFAQSSLHI